MITMCWCGVEYTVCRESLEAMPGGAAETSLKACLHYEV